MPVPDEDLPVLLPDNVDYAGSGVNPLTRDEAFLNVPCPHRTASRRSARPTRWTRSSTRPGTGIATSRPGKPDAPIDDDQVEAWTPVEQYTGGAEHAVMHLLYAREFTKMMRDIGLVQQNEPWGRSSTRARSWAWTASGCRSRGATSRTPTSSSRSTARTSIRLFLMFMGPWDQGGPWSPTGIGGVHRFLSRVWTITIDPHGIEPGDAESGDAARRRGRGRGRTAIRRAAHRTLRDVTGDYKAFQFNTMVAKLMELANTLMRYRGTSVAGLPEWDEAVRLLLLMLAPAAPHITEELWSRRLAAAGEPWSSIHTSVARGRRDGGGGGTREVPIQVNGKVRDRVTVPAGISEIELEQVVLSRDKIVAILGGKAADADHPRGRRPAREHRRPRLTPEGGARWTAGARSRGTKTTSRSRGGGGTAASSRCVP